MKTLPLVLLVSLVTLISFPQNSYGLVIPIPTTTPFPWADFIKQKLAALPLASTSESPVSTTAKPPAVNSEVLISNFIKQLVAHIKEKVENQTAIEVSTTVAPPTTTTEGSEVPENNYEDALLREVYLDWGKRHARQIEIIDDQPEVEVQGEEPLPLSAPESVPTAQAPNPIYPSVPLTYGYPAPAPYPFGLYPPLAAFKIQKGVIQAQMDAALAAMGITTTPKPTKVKLKFLLPAGSSLPAGLENFVVS